MCCHEQRCCFSAVVTLRVMALFILRDKECFFVSVGVLNRLVLKPFAPAFFPARGTALWPPSVNGQPALLPVCQVTPTSQSLENQKNFNPRRQISWSQPWWNTKLTPRWANRFLSAVSTTAGVLLDVEFWQLWHRHMGKIQKQSERKNLSDVSKSSLKVKTALKLRVEKIFSGDCVPEHKWEVWAQHFHLWEKTLWSLCFLRIAVKKLRRQCWILKLQWRWTQACGSRLRLCSYFCDVSISSQGISRIVILQLC